MPQRLLTENASAAGWVTLDAAVDGTLRQLIEYLHIDLL